MRTVNDGAPRIRALVQDRWLHAEQMLGFYHASGHLHGLAEALHGADPAATQAWARPRRRRLRHGNTAKLLEELSLLPQPEGGAGAVIRREQN